MNDERMQSVLEEWFRARDAAPEDVRRSARQVMERKAQVRQRSRGWPFPVLYRRTKTPAATDTSAYQPIPIPATNGHTPTLIGRTQTMFSPAKAVTAAALVFGIGGVLLIAQPFGQESGSIPGAATDVGPQPPAEFTGSISCGPPVAADRAGTEETLEVGDEGLVLTRFRDGAWRQTGTMTDPRLEGTYRHTWESDTYRLPGSESGPFVSAWTLRIENEEGAWQEVGFEGTYTDGTPMADGPGVLIGEGAYEGLTALMEATSTDDPCTIDVRGMIFEDAPVPVPYVSE